jgi:hypothetical protein
LVSYSRSDHVRRREALLDVAHGQIEPLDHVGGLVGTLDPLNCARAGLEKIRDRLN